MLRALPIAIALTWLSHISIIRGAAIPETVPDAAAQINTTTTPAQDLEDPALRRYPADGASPHPYSISSSRDRIQLRYTNRAYSESQNRILPGLIVLCANQHAQALISLGKPGSYELQTNERNPPVPGCTGWTAAIALGRGFYPLTLEQAVWTLYAVAAAARQVDGERRHLFAEEAYVDSVLERWNGVGYDRLPVCRASLNGGRDGAGEEAGGGGEEAVVAAS